MHSQNTRIHFNSLGFIGGWRLPQRIMSYISCNCYTPMISHHPRHSKLLFTLLGVLLARGVWCIWERASTTFTLRLKKICPEFGEEERVHSQLVFSYYRNESWFIILVKLLPVLNLRFGYVSMVSARNILGHTRTQNTLARHLMEIARGGRHSSSIV